MSAKAQKEPIGGHRLKPDGGYVQISALTLGLLWWCYSEGLLSLRAVRVGLALFELRLRRAVYDLVERRKGNKPEFTPRYSTKELGDFCGLPEKRAKAALGELLALGLVSEFSETQIVFARSLGSLSLTDGQRAEFLSWFGLLTKRKRISIPRRVLALSCESSGPALIAVILGACIRCCWRHPEGFSYSGRLACTWLARHFRLSLRAVRSAKEQLVALQFLRRKHDVSRFGDLVEINPAWHRLISLPEAQRENHQDQPQDHHDGAGEPPRELAPVVHLDEPPSPPPAPETGTNSAGVPAPAGTNSAGVSLIRESLPSGESKDQRESRGSRPEPKAGPGVFQTTPQREPKNQDPKAGEKTLPAPRLSKIIPEDFASTERALELFRQAVKCGLVPNDSEHSRLLWMATIERARTAHDVRNPAGVFLFLVKNRKWDFLSDGHFDGGNERIKKFLHAPAPGQVPFLVPTTPPISKPEPPHEPCLSRDALLVKTVREALHRRGIEGSVFAALRAHAGWDRDRYASALAELENHEPSTAQAV